MWDDGSGPPLRGRSDRDDQDGHPGYGGGGHRDVYRSEYQDGYGQDGYGQQRGYGRQAGYDQQGPVPRGTDEVIGYDIPTTFLPVQKEPLSRPRRQRRKRRPVLTVALVTVATVSIGGGAGLLMARALDKGAPPSTTVAVAPSTPEQSTSSAPAGRTTPAGVPAVRPSSATTKASRSDPSRSARPPAPATSSAKAPSGTTPRSSTAPTGNPTLEAQVLTLVNEQRSKAGCKALKSNGKLVLAARRHSQFMADTGKHGHEGIGDGTPQERIDKAGYRPAGWAENIAWGYTGPASVMDGWMHSAGHKANILNCSYTEIGVGVDRGGRNWTQVFGIPA